VDWGSKRHWANAMRLMFRAKTVANAMRLMFRARTVANAMRLMFSEANDLRFAFGNLRGSVESVGQVATGDRVQCLKGREALRAVHGPREPVIGRPLTNPSCDLSYVIGFGSLRRSKATNRVELPKLASSISPVQPFRRA